MTLGNKKEPESKAEESTPTVEPQEDARSMRFIYAILGHRRAVIIFFAIFTILCALCVPLVNVNYNLASYLPQGSNSTEAMDLMEEVYDSEIPNTRMYAQGISLTQANDLAGDLQSIDGVDDVLWLGSQVDIVQPLEVIDPKTLDSWMTDEGFLFQLTIDGDKASEALDAVRASAYDQGASEVALSGDAVTTVSAQESTASEIMYIMLMAVVIIIVIISLTSESWFEWVIFLLVLAMAIMMNMGTNIVRGEISFITQICAAVLQLAVSMDYAIVMLHTFRRYQGEYPDDPVKAMAHAMHKGFSVVLSSAAVTFFGFLSLSVMSFLIGVDMGIVLAKGIFFSFLAVMFLMPCIILACLKPLKRFEHRPLLPSFDRFGAWCTKLMIPLSIVVCIIAVPAMMGQGRTDFSYGAAGMAEEGTQLGDESRIVDDAFAASETWVMMVPDGQWAKEKALAADLEALPEVDNVVSYVNTVGEQIPAEMVPDEQLSQLMAGGYTRIVIQTTLDANNGTNYDMVEEVREIGRSYYGDESYLAGTQVSEYDLKVTTGEDSSRVKLFSIGAIALVLMLMFRSLSIPLIVLLPIEISIWINLAVPYFTGQSINYIGYLVIDAVQLGASVDYAIIYTREYLEQRGKYPALKAARVAISKSAITIMTSALILTIAGVSIYLIASNSIISEIGMLIGRGAFISMLMMFTLLPLLFVLCDWLVRHTTIGLHFFGSGKGSNTQNDFKNKPLDGRGTNIKTLIKSNFIQKKTQIMEANMYESKNTSKKGQRARKNALSILCSVTLVAATIPAFALSAYATSEEEVKGVEATTTTSTASDASSLASDPAKSATTQGKEEVVYTKLSGDGSVKGVYVVNGFNLDKQSEVVDSGDYLSLTNLSTSDELTSKNGKIEFSAPEGDFFYKGELDADTNMPWQIELDYKLDGKKVEAENLAGASGKLEIGLKVIPDGEETSIFVDNYLLQASASFASDSVSSLEADGGSVAVAGSQHLVTFMVLPQGEGDFTISADVDDFTFAGFTIVAVPVSFALDVDSLESDELTANMDDLKEAVTQLDDGAATLGEGSNAIANGIATLSSMNYTLSNGSSQVSAAIGQVSSGASILAAGSTAYVDGVQAQAVDASTKASEAGTLAFQKQQEYAGSMASAQASLTSAGTNLATAYAALESNDPVAVKAALDALAGDLGTTGASVSSAATAIGDEHNPGLVSYQAQASAYQASSDTCWGLSAAYSDLDSGIQGFAATAPTLVSEYATFDGGLNAYLGGVQTLDTNYGTFQQGMTTYQEGTAEFKSRTATLDQDLIDGVKEELQKYLGADYELHSFVDPTNKNVEKVQFIYMSDPIEKPAEEAVPEEEPEEQTPWTRLLALFS